MIALSDAAAAFWAAVGGAVAGGAFSFGGSWLGGRLQEGRIDKLTTRMRRRERTEARRERALTEFRAEVVDALEATEAVQAKGAPSSRWKPERLDDAEEWHHLRHLLDLLLARWNREYSSHVQDADVIELLPGVRHTYRIATQVELGEWSSSVTHLERLRSALLELDMKLRELLWAERFEENGKEVTGAGSD